MSNTSNKSIFYALIASGHALVPVSDNEHVRAFLSGIMNALVEGAYIQEVRNPRENQFTLHANGVSMPLSGKALQDALAEEAEAMEALDGLLDELERTQNEAVRAAKAVAL